MSRMPLFCSDRYFLENKPIVEKYISLDWVEWVSKTPSHPFLIVDQGYLGLADATWPKVHPVSVDFCSNASEHRRLHGGGAGQAVAKAVGLNKRKDLNVLDATAGLGRDSYVMASIGANVLMLERNRVVSLLLQDGLERLSIVERLSEISDRLTLTHTSLLNSDIKSLEFVPDVVYLDPMFPERGKSAKVKKDMAIFHDIVGPDSDADGLLRPAIDLATYRVVVKRSKSAPYLDNQKPSTSLIGKSSRFDIYAKKSLN